MNRQRLDENVRLITEMLSISDEVLSVVNIIFSDLQKSYYYFSLDKTSDNLYEGTYALTYNLWGQQIRMEFYIYDFTNRETFKKEINNIKFNNRFSPNAKTLYVTVVFLYGRLLKGFCEDSIYHEVEHCYQWCLEMNNNPNYKGLVDDAYAHASEIINNQEDDNIRERIAWIMYYSNLREQDAYIHQYYGQYEQSPMRFDRGETEVDEHYQYLKKAVEWLNNEIGKPYLQPYLQEYLNYGYSPKNILNYANKGVKRFFDKMRHVKAYVRMMDEGSTPIHSCKTGAKILKNNENLIKEIAKTILQEAKRHPKTNPTKN